jgi:hypothetical protein
MREEIQTWLDKAAEDWKAGEEARVFKERVRLFWETIFPCLA